jgi:hypothetical protein
VEYIASTFRIEKEEKEEEEEVEQEISLKIVSDCRLISS